ncbi:hypothetical protein LEP1GSC021_1324 [Leptospira noguchii str. 1993005606]|nr:hypothetical protein LEP1GSC021_1324 [Leptospira noguchii str. 1993005606]
MTILQTNSKIVGTHIFENPSSIFYTLLTLFKKKSILMDSFCL